MPLYRRHYARYSHYLPLDHLSTGTQSLRSRATRWIAARRQRLMVVGGGRRVGDENDIGLAGSDDGDDDDEDFDILDDAEELAVVDARPMGSGPRTGGGLRGDSTSRLSRE